MTAATDGVSVSILDKEYVIACPDNERESLLSSAKFLDERMRATRDHGKALGTERMAVMTALNIVHEFLQQQKEKEQAERVVNDCVKTLEQKIVHALSRPDTLEQID